MKLFFKKVFLSIVLFFLTLSLFSSWSFAWGVFPIALLLILLVCIVTEGVLLFFDKKFHSAVVLIVATLVSIPFYPSVAFVVPIYIGAVGYDIGRRLFAEG
ncbi:hypothetical protein JV16_02924 [Anoxybacillus ayderensis]|uniref:Phosphatidate cytidylyltransferase n=1 Tax=Anoxybacillus ayderensis TaxID=265546 RepID=A0A0D0GW05_9BACL|nr:hypothetical protein [Anoxybacillus ayderensis]EPZ37217.1 hypothetical protein C289_2760 [Anoxybacillus ayderensis]KIP19926.1 hypothetical protein JV16_02924 [Anoxybacillus ayderensis]